MAMVLSWPDKWDRGHLTIGEGAIVAAKSGVRKSIPAKTIAWGIPAKPQAQAKRANAAFQRLPEYQKVIQELKKRVKELESRLKND